MSCARKHSHKGKNSDIDNNLKEESWVQFLTERASEAAVNIHKSTLSDNLEMSVDCNSQNGCPSGSSQADVKWMETVQLL